MNLQEFLKPKNGIMSKSDQKIYNLVLNHPSHIPLSTIQKVAVDANISVASVQRYCKKLGYDGYKEFKYELKKFLLKINDGNNNRNYLNDYITVVNSLKNFDQKTIKMIANDLLGSRYSYLMGIYYSSLPAKQLAMGLQDLNKMSIYTDNYVTTSHWASLMSHEDVFILFSVSGNELNSKKYLPILLEKTDKTYLVTFNPDASLRKHFRHLIVLPGKSFVYNASFDIQSLVSLFVELIIECMVKIEENS